jgi:hypothetical protein
VKGSFDLGLVFNANKVTSGDVTRFVDSDYGDDLDKGRSISTYIFSLCTGAISWKASLQSIATLSTAEAEYVAATESVKEATWLRGLILELDISQDTTVVFSDSQSAIHLSRMMLIILRPRILTLNTIISEILLLREKLL